MIINALYDSSVATAPASYKSGIASAIQIIQQSFGANITINIHFGWGEVNGSAIPTGAAGANVSNGAMYTYNQVSTALKAAATSDTDFASLGSLPTTDPTNGGQFWVTDAQAATLKLANPASIDVYVGLGSSLPFTFDPAHRAEAGKYDGIGVLLHEITEVMGRLGWLGSYYDPSLKNVYGILDLFRYSAPGVRDTKGNGYFSADGGVTLLTKFNDPSKTTGDVADWTPTLQGDSFGATAAGVADQLTTADLKVMDVLGYTLTSLNGTTGNDAFFSTANNETFSGAAGTDSVTFHGAHVDYAISGTYPTITVTDSVANRDGQDTLSSVEVLKFTDISLVFGLTSVQDKIVYELYQAAFARVPDLAGFTNWANIADSSHQSAVQLASAFTTVAEFVSKYGTDPGAAYISALYTNVLGRAPDDSGLSFWLAKGESQAQLLADFATSPENVQLASNHMANGFWVT